MYRTSSTKRNKPTTESRRWFNFVQSTNDIAEIRTIYRIQTHSAAPTVCLSKLFAAFYHCENINPAAKWAARSVAMQNMLITLNAIEETTGFIKNRRKA